MNRAETEDGAYASAQNRKLLAGLGLKPGENEYAEPALNPCQTTAYAFFTGDELVEGWRAHAGVLVLVTHQVNITALTGVYRNYSPPHRREKLNLVRHMAECRDF